MESEGSKNAALSTFLSSHYTHQRENFSSVPSGKSTSSTLENPFANSTLVNLRTLYLNVSLAAGDYIKNLPSRFRIEIGVYKFLCTERRLAGACMSKIT